jgi:hypothetical protein
VLPKHQEAFHGGTFGIGLFEKVRGGFAGKDNACGDRAYQTEDKQ